MQHRSGVSRPPANKENKWGNLSSPQLGERTYRGRRGTDGTSRVWTESAPRAGNLPERSELAPHLDVRAHSPTGFAGYMAAIWQNNTDSGVRYNVTFERLYNQEGEWRSTNSFGRDDLLLLGKVADLAHSWIIEPEPTEAGAPQKAGRNAAPDLAGKSLPKRPNAAKGGD